MKIQRNLLSVLKNDLEKTNKGLIIYGPRQVGKTTLVNDLLNEFKWNTLILNGDQRGQWWELLISRELSKLTLLVSGYDAVVIDEAQRIPEIGLSLKILLDNFPKLKVIITGSSSLDLASKISEPLTGRIYSYKLFPISQKELRVVNTPYEIEQQIEERLIYGSYPEIFSLESIQEKAKYLENLTNNYLYKDLLEFGDIRNSSKIHDLLRLVAFQIGNQVSISELAKTLEINRTTVDRYIDLLEKSFIIFRLPGFSRNMRKEVTKMDKIFFYDTGVRNSIIGNLNMLNSRDDVGKLWENFLIVERMKKLSYEQKLFSQYFWRLTSGAEIDLIEETEGNLHGFELKHGKKTAKIPDSWRISYPQATSTLVNKDNWQNFVI
ncbi:AAA family ATPase [Candidatus Roizmanbacteria bacterium RIFOXYB2_FULL_41_10]|uniref:AAA family ATPase n=1 Tax=Candidatus Roizmanbacteria bacterium RIFOXYA1_FULL_41_12 TaxID=1802082 RepID=A0A1F7K9I5_9BACT|nr:MAG: AAA family ATPase [Candidatus Roizmanbacteria bacterium RIFOXYA1_FULL_41_12]OGK67296.1 MAG: AAA family ATPase [Candidatus Roizmanbacteria bacterium RIFOXYB1_FULL_41_27]OGK69154.1 MAG: AAA family ATPase [Candidatus Roizmanbacteria bacterium RIFOXYB2_FULL_41_10]OGK71829.1 MAG: AAA family ATPase [Candidatus Roizmanbacteria bacterium RIFOXYC1_FULL_41_16]OGK74883.1 MAG: AAA family ATPase [Candidatus Roizmanbacteria bacterium RIFOXYD1_FULL_41_24]OGK75745.1 MAG: AAA family ATPase [Candidatus 